jgi:tetratricopeptide repeat protein
VARYHAVLGDEHPFTLAAAVDLAVVVRATGRYAEARTIDTEALSGLRRSVGMDHPFALACANGLAADLRQTGEAQQAREIAADIVSRSRTVRGADHPETAACAWNMALDDGDDVAQQQAITALTKAYGEGHPILAGVAAGVRLETDIDVPPL